MQLLWKILLSALIISSCSASKNYLERADEDRALADAVKKLSKSPDDENAKEAIPVLYASIQKNHLAKIKALSDSRELTRWDKIIDAYESLETAYNNILNSTAAFKLVNLKSYSTALFETKEAAAEEHYQAATGLMNKTGRSNLKKAYDFFIKADNLLPGYKDAIVKSEDAYAAAVIDVVINPVQDNAYFLNSGWGNSGYNFSNEFFQQNLVRDLTGVNNNRNPARFYSDWQARRDNIKPNWVVDLVLRNMDIPYPQNYNYTRNASNRIQTGADTSGIPLYKTVTATLHITRSSFTARADMDVNITEAATGKNISYRNFRDTYRWQEERATYSGDSRALSARDWELINNYNYGSPRKEEILNELYKKIYPQVKNNISYAVDW